MKTKCSHCERLRLNASMILFGQGENTKTDVCFDEILLNAKFYIYKCRLNKIRPSIHHFNNDLKRTYKIDKHIHNLEMQTDKFYRKWLLYTDLVN